MLPGCRRPTSLVLVHRPHLDSKQGVCVYVRFEVPLYLIPLNPGSWGVDRSYLKRNRTIGDVFENFHKGLVVHLNDAGSVGG